MIGSGGIGAFPMAGLIAKGVQVPDILDLVATRAQCFLQPWPWLEFYTITTENNGTKRYVDFQDPDARGSLPNLVPFNGEEFQSRRMERTAIRSAADSVTSFSVSVSDVDGEVVTIASAEDGLERAPIQIDSIPYDLIDQPALATTENYRIRASSATMSPARVTFEVGLPSLIDIDVPGIAFDRYRCFNDFNRRFELDSRCRAPSDDFNVGTQQVLGSDENNAAATTWPGVKTKRKYGWYTLNANVADTWKTGEVSLPAVFPTDLWTVSESAFPISHDWRNGAQLGMYMFKLLPNTDWTVETHLSFLDNVKLERNSGLVIQSDGSVNEWVFWGNAINAGTTEVLRRRVTTAGISVDTDDVDLSDGAAYFRIEWTLSDTTLKLYVKPDDSSPWVLKQTTVKAFTSPTRIGLVVASDSGAALSLLSTHFRFMRFTAGGPDDCNRSLEACQEEGRDNEHQRNAFPGIPTIATNT